MMADAPAPRQDNPTQQVHQVPVDDVVPHPDNVRSTVGDVSELADSITEQGVLQPLTVVAMDVFLDRNPGMVDRKLRSGTWVVIAGHRRLAAARKAKIATVPVIVRDDLAAAEHATTAMIVENVQREGLSPLEEARAFARLRDAKWSQRQIAQATGVSHGQVAKRLSLLRLPATLQTLLERGKLSVAEALLLLELPDAEIEPAWTCSTTETWRSLREIVRTAKSRLAADKAAAALTKELDAAGVQVVGDHDGARELLEQHGVDPDQVWDHMFPVGATLEDLPSPTDTIAVVRPRPHYGEAEVLYYSRTAPFRDDENNDDEYDLGDGDAGGTEASVAGASAGSSGDSHAQWQLEQERLDAQRTADKRAAEHAATARAQACARLVTRDPFPVELVTEVLADFVLVNSCLDDVGPGTVAAGWLGVDLNPDGTLDEVDVEERWIDAQGDAGGLTALRAAFGVALADLDNTLPLVRGWNGEYPTWTTRQIRHIRRLVEHADHQLHPLEQTVLERSEAAHAAQDAADTVANETDSAAADVGEVVA